MKTAAFIGAGNMGGALARAVCAAAGGEQVVIADHTRSKAEALALELGCAAAKNNRSALLEAQYIFLCVKPQGMRLLLSELDRALEGCTEEKVFISVAAGLTLKTLREYLSSAGSRVPILRIMPNTCVAIGKGMTALSAPDGTDEAILRSVEELLTNTGRVERMPEHLLDQFTALAGCGPAFVYPYIEALADGAVAAGLPRAGALEYAAQTVLGAAAMVLETGKHPGQLKDEVCSPGGSTIAGVAELERHGLRAAALDAVLAAYQKNQALGK